MPRLTGDHVRMRVTVDLVNELGESQSRRLGHVRFPMRYDLEMGAGLTATETGECIMRFCREYERGV